MVGLGKSNNCSEESVIITTESEIMDAVHNCFISFVILIIIYLSLKRLNIFILDEYELVIEEDD